jgi:hypothetical protein
MFQSQIFFNALNASKINYFKLSNAEVTPRVHYQKLMKNHPVFFSLDVFDQYKKKYSLIDKNLPNALLQISSSSIITANALKTKMLLLRLFFAFSQSFANYPLTGHPFFLYNNVRSHGERLLVVNYSKFFSR